MIKFAEQLKTYRKKNSLSQDDLAAKLSISRQAISKWEAGDSTPDLDNVVKLAGIFNVSLDDLVLGLKNDPKIDSSQFVFDPQKNKYVRRYGTMNFWDFLGHFWWLTLIFLFVIFVLGFFIALSLGSH
ncbi:helix-turn-helix transcriptional regulator [Lactobacillus sp. ESL0791]|uniref:helix-turn-helix transcriptional regulator n=1 Tax=Lactobacillus sp. ESL0791 TaxID=2983234 RepID=UPI0023F6E601|nr:helix-turn-helix transcriptional regulator [Lactobacillus sp. ESL0791]MDF7638935.1 helix-turn-helix transcriptional regulator [Lactobacillus sp. ESL0791]